MCIRDRYFLQHAIVPRQASRIAGPGGAGRPGDPPWAVAAGLHSACLLYTSDAADERSSVDLGGRRIIKKKKK